MSYWAGRCIAVTGAGGFIGSHLVEALARSGAQVRAMVRYNSRNDRGALEWLDNDAWDGIDVCAGDIRDLESVIETVKGCDVVFHLAAYVGIPYSYVDPRAFFEVNVLGTLNVALASRDAGVDRLIHTSTSEIYGTAQEVPITESHPIRGQSPYAASKIGADQLVLSFHRSYGLRATVLRPFNTYGPRQSARAVIPTIITQTLRGDTIRLGSLEPRRDLTYVKDTVGGFMAIATAEEAIGDTVQLGTGRDYSVSELVEAVGKVIGRQLSVEQEEARIRPGRSEVMRLVSSPKRMLSLTGWKPRTSLAEGLAETIEWISAHRSNYQIGEYAI